MLRCSYRSLTVVFVLSSSDERREDQEESEEVDVVEETFSARLGGECVGGFSHGILVALGGCEDGGPICVEAGAVG